MPNYFALLGLAPAAALDADALKQRYHALSREAHPDSSEDQDVDAATLNAAFQCLSQPSSRLKHLLEVIAPEAVERLKGGQIPESFMILFSDVASAVQSADAVIAKKKAATSALGKALLADSEMQAREALESAGAVIADHRASLDRDALVEVDVLLSREDTATATSKIAEAFRAYGFLDKWQNQVRAKLLELFEAGTS